MMQTSARRTDLALVVIGGAIAAWTLPIEGVAQALPLHGESVTRFENVNALKELLDDGAQRLRGEGQALTQLQWVADAPAREALAPMLPRLSGLFFEKAASPAWQLLSWEWLSARLALGVENPLTKNRAPFEKMALPWLVLADSATERQQQEAALAREYEDGKARLVAEHARLQHENERLRAQNAGLKSVDTERLVTFLPALFYRVFNEIGPADLAALCGKVEPLNIPNPYPEPTEPTLRTLQKRFAALPAHLQQEIIGFVDRLPHRQKITPRPEMRQWLDPFEER
jgi:hypothetical protein